jgi:hypothetical protein
VVAEPVGHLELQLDELGRVEAQGILEEPDTNSVSREKRERKRRRRKAKVKVLGSP